MTMPDPTDCKKNTDALKLIRKGTPQDLRESPALDPGSAPVDEHTPAHAMVFAKKYAKYLTYFNLSNLGSGDWQPFFSADVSVRLAVAAVADVENYRQQTRTYANFLDDRASDGKDAELRDHLDYLFSCCASLAIGLNALLAAIPAEISFKDLLRNLVQTQLAPSLTHLIAYHEGGLTLTPTPINNAGAEKAAPLEILGAMAGPFSDLQDADLSTDWTDGTDWPTYYQAIAADASVYGTPPGSTVFELANHLATHNLFTSILDQFLKAYARTAGEAQAALEATFTAYDRHEPHYALFLAFLRLFGHARSEINTLTRRHLDFYYRVVLQLEEKAAVPAKAHLVAELSKQTTTHLIEAGALFKAGKDDQGIDAYFANDRDVVINRAKVASLKTLYHHGDEPVGLVSPTIMDKGRLYGSPVADSADGQGAPLPPEDPSWHPFYNKTYQDGLLADIDMAPAEVGFALASHYLLLAEGYREILLLISVSGYSGSVGEDLSNKIVCRLTSEKGWIEKTAWFFPYTQDTFIVYIEVDGSDPPITPYQQKTHGSTFATDVPIVSVTLNQDPTDTYGYDALRDIVVTEIELQVYVDNLRSLAVSNDFGPIDTSKPFQPYGASPVAGSALVIGSKEVFQKHLTSAAVQTAWLSAPNPYPSDKAVKVEIDFLRGGEWLPSAIPAIDVDATYYFFSQNLDYPVVDEPDLDTNAYFATVSRSGFVRLRLDSDFGQQDYQAYLLKYIRKDSDATTEPGPPPVGPTVNALSLSYGALQTIRPGFHRCRGLRRPYGPFFSSGAFRRGRATPLPRVHRRGAPSAPVRRSAR